MRPGLYRTVHPAEYMLDQKGRVKRKECQPAFFSHSSLLFRNMLFMSPLRQGHRYHICRFRKRQQPKEHQISIRSESGSEQG